MVYLLAVVIIALTFSRWAAIASAVLSVAAFRPQLCAATGYIYRQRPAVSAHLFHHAGRGFGHFQTHGARGKEQAQEQSKLAIEAESEANRRALLASISHDLRTPWPVLMGASSSLVETGDRMDPEERAALAASIYSRTCEMTDQVDRILK